MAHEWWANLVTAKNWNDFWIHEGFATYSQALYCEELGGPEAYFREMGEKRGGIANRGTMAPRETRGTRDMYFGDRPDSPGGDIYNKGSWILHSLRWKLGDEVFFKALRRMAYPDPAKEKLTDGSACRFATTDEIQGIAEKVSGEDLDWFFELYLRQPKLPMLVQKRRGDKLQLAWETPADLDFPMPVQVRVGDELVRVEMDGGKGELSVGEGTDVVVDPHTWILKEEMRRSR
jgi:aminopeptidase N